jgi:predicted methyltransferase
MRIKLLAMAAVLAVPLAAASSLPAFAQQATDPALASVLADSRRDGDRARDAHRHRPRRSPSSRSGRE